MFNSKFNFTGTDAEIVSQLKASGVTARPISLAELLYTLNMRGMLVKLALPGDGGEKWSGSIISLIGAINQIGTDSQKLAVSIWFSHITNSRNSTWDTTRPEHAAPFWQLYLAFAGQPGMPTQADFQAIAALGGGWLFSTLTVEQYQSDRTAHEQALADAESQRLEREAAQLNQARKIQMYSALIDAGRWVESQDQCPTQAELLDYLTPNLPSEE